MGSDYFYNIPEKGIAVFYDYLDLEDSVFMDFFMKKFKESGYSARDEVDARCIPMQTTICLTDHLGRTFPVISLHDYLEELGKQLHEPRIMHSYNFDES